MLWLTFLDRSDSGGRRKRRKIGPARRPVNFLVEAFFLFLRQNDKPSCERKCRKRWLAQGSLGLSKAKKIRECTAQAGLLLLILHQSYHFHDLKTSCLPVWSRRIEQNVLNDPNFIQTNLYEPDKIGSSHEKFDVWPTPKCDKFFLVQIFSWNIFVLRGWSTDQ